MLFIDAVRSPSRGRGTLKLPPQWLVCGREREELRLRCEDAGDEFGDSYVDDVVEFDDVGVRGFVGLMDRY